MSKGKEMIIATDFELWAGKWCFEMSKKEEGALRLQYALVKDSM